MHKILNIFLFLLACTSAFATEPSGTLPVLYINTENNTAITSKETYVNATYYLDNMGIEGIEAIGSKDEPLSMQIRGRGNYTWSDFDKKPYRLKLADKQPLLGMKKNKHFALLAHADDNNGFMSDVAGFELSRLIGMPWTPADAPVEVVLNGDYIGLYFLTELIRVDKHRVNIVEQPDNISDPDSIKGGWLVEIDNYDSDPHVTISENGHDVWFTYKTPEVLSQAQEDYLTAQMNRINEAVYREDLTDNTWEDYVDTAQLARFYLVQELVDNYESFHGSCYMYKDLTDDKWKFGPVWDFGSAFMRGTKTQWMYDGMWHQVWIKQMCAHPQFLEEVKNVWRNFYYTNYNDIYAYLDNYANRIAQAAERDAERWPNYGNSGVVEKERKVKAFLRGSVRWLNKNLLGTETYDYYVIGVFNNWTCGDESCLMEMTAPGIYSVTLPKISKEFKINSGAWGTDVDYGSNGEPLELGKPYSFVNGSHDNIVIDMEADEMANATVMLNTNDATITVTSADDIRGVSTTQDALKVKAFGNRLFIESPTDSSLRIYDMSGRAITLPLSRGMNTISTLPAGLYIVEGMKIMLK